MIKFLFNVRLRFCAPQIIQRTKNPYLYLNPAQLKTMINSKIIQKKHSIQHINALIELAMASENKKMNNEIRILLQNCVMKLQNAQQFINETKQGDLAQLEMGKLLNILSRYPNHLSLKLSQTLTQLYINTYRHMFNLKKQMQIYQFSRNNHNLDLVTKISQQKLQSGFKSNQKSLSYHIGYLRLFYQSMSAMQINQQLNHLFKTCTNRQVSQQQKLILSFIMISSGADFGLIQRQGLQPKLDINPNQQDKMICIKLQIIKFKKLNLPSLNDINLQNWSYNNLIWVSQFAQGQPLFIQKLHSQIIKSNLPSETRPSSIFTYALNTKIDQTKHRQICRWLCQQNRIRTDHQHDLCQIIKLIHEYQWQPYYTNFFKLVLKLSLGNFKWQSHNTIYYYGHIQQINDQNMEYLRRYILNTYASLGTARKQVPTSSYFYKILGVIEVQKFYGHL